MFESRELVLAYRTYSWPRSEVIVGMLQAYGIDAILCDRHFNSNNGHELIATGGFRILVPQERLRDAAQLLEPFQDSDDHPESEAFQKSLPSSLFWLFSSLFMGVWIPAWLRKRDR